jgi:hypothetical protein
VTMSAGVPTVWLALLAYCEEHWLTFSTLKIACIGGAAAPMSMLEAFEIKCVKCSATHLQRNGGGAGDEAICVGWGWGMEQVCRSCRHHHRGAP